MKSASPAQCSRNRMSCKLSTLAESNQRMVQPGYTAHHTSIQDINRLSISEAGHDPTLPSFSYIHTIVSHLCPIHARYRAAMVSSINQKELDFIVVGGGTAGNVVAGRLAESPNISIAVIEAGLGSRMRDPFVPPSQDTIEPGYKERIRSQPFVARVMLPSLALCSLHSRMSMEGMELFIFCFLYPPTQQAFDILPTMLQLGGAFVRLKTVRVKRHRVMNVVVVGVENVVREKSGLTVSLRKRLRAAGISRRHVIA